MSKFWTQCELLQTSRIPNQIKSDFIHGKLPLPRLFPGGFRDWNLSICSHSNNCVTLVTNWYLIKCGRLHNQQKGAKKLCSISRPGKVWWLKCYMLPIVINCPMSNFYFTGKKDDRRRRRWRKPLVWFSSSFFRLFFSRIFRHQSLSIAITAENRVNTIESDITAVINYFRELNRKSRLPCFHRCQSLPVDGVHFSHCRIFRADLNAFWIQTSIVCAQQGKAPGGLQKLLMALETSAGI